MAAQHGTLNIVEKGGFLALSLPASAFPYLDTNKNDTISQREFQYSQTKILADVTSNIVLIEDEKKHFLKGVMLSLVPPHKGLNSTTAQVLVLGRFVFQDIQEKARFQSTLFGTLKGEDTLKIKVMRKSHDQEKTFILTPRKKEDTLGNLP
jgi:hypothetical protein